MSQIHVQYQGKLRTSGRPKVPSSIVVKETLNNTSSFRERTLSQIPLIAKELNLNKKKVFALRFDMMFPVQLSVCPQSL